MKLCTIGITEFLQIPKFNFDRFKLISQKLIKIDNGIIENGKINLYLINQLFLSLIEFSLLFLVLI